MSVISTKPNKPTLLTFLTYQTKNVERRRYIYIPQKLNIPGTLWWPLFLKFNPHPPKQNKAEIPISNTGHRRVPGSFPKMAIFEVFCHFFPNLHQLKCSKISLPGNENGHIPTKRRVNFAGKIIDSRFAADLKGICDPSFRGRVSNVKKNRILGWCRKCW